MTAVKLRRIGTSQGVILPKDILVRLHVSEGDMLFLTETKDGLLLTPHDPDFERQMRLAREVSKRRRNVLKALAE